MAAACVRDRGLRARAHRDVPGVRRAAGVVVPGDVILAVRASTPLAVRWRFRSSSHWAWSGRSPGRSWFWLGRRYGRGAVERLPFADRIGTRVDRASDAIHDNAGKTIVVGRLATGVAGLVPFAAGIAGVPFTTFVAYTVPLIVVWATAVVMLGVLVGNNIDLIDRILSSFGWIVLASVALVLGGRWGWRRWQARHA